MKKLTIVMIAASVLISGCVVYDRPHRDSGNHRGDRDRGDDVRSHDRDRDGVPNSVDRRPNNPNRY